MKQYLFLMCAMRLLMPSAFCQKEADPQDEFTAKIDAIVEDGIRKQAFPGAQVLVAHKGKVVLHKTYGFHTYDSIEPVARSLGLYRP